MSVIVRHTMDIVIDDGESPFQIKMDIRSAKAILENVQEIENFVRRYSGVELIV